MESLFVHLALGIGGSMIVSVATVIIIELGHLWTDEERRRGLLTRLQNDGLAGVIRHALGHG